MNTPKIHEKYPQKQTFSLPIEGRLVGECFCRLIKSLPSKYNGNTRFSNDNESNFIAMNYIDHIIGDVQASSSKRNELVFVYIHLHSGIVSTLFSRISMYDTKKQNHNALFKPNNAVSKFMTKGASSLGLWAPIFVEMKQNIGRGAEEQEKCASAKYGLYCRYSANINTFVINSIMLILY